jgi:hypothetical protein
MTRWVVLAARVRGRGELGGGAVVPKVHARDEVTKVGLQPRLLLDLLNFLKPLANSV